MKKIIPLVLCVLLVVGACMASGPNIYKIARLEMKVMKEMSACITEMALSCPEAARAYEHHAKAISADLDELDKATQEK